MPFDGSGTHSPSYTFANETPPVDIDKLDETLADMSSGLSNAILRDGTGLPSAHIPFNGKRIQDLGTPSASTDAATKGYVDGYARKKLVQCQQKSASWTVTDADHGYLFQCVTNNINVTLNDTVAVGTEIRVMKYDPGIVVTFVGGAGVSLATTNSIINTQYEVKTAVYFGASVWMIY